MRPRILSSATVLIQVSPTSQGRAIPAPMMKRSRSQASGEGNSGISRNPLPTRTQPSAIDGMVPSRPTSFGKSGRQSRIASAGALPARPFSQVGAPHCSKVSAVMG